MNKIKHWFLKNKDYFYPGLISGLILLLAFMIMGVYPFGKTYTGMMDYNHGLVPSYTHLWDFIHGESNFFFNENLGMGANIYASSVLNTFFSPLSYLVGLFPRDRINHAISYVVALKMVLMATTSYIVFKKWFKNIDYKMICLFSLLWTFSSWLFVHISNVGWLDVMIIFPFLIESLKTLIEKGKISYFVFMLTLCLIFSYYMSYMILIMMIVGVICASFTIIEKKDRKRVIGQIFIATLFSLCLSMFAFLPSFMQTQASYRFSDMIDTNSNMPFYTKLLMILFYPVILYFPYKLFKGYKDDKNVKFFMWFLFATLIPIVLEPINKMWHTGSYFSYPFRFSYIPIFFMILASLYYFNRYYDKEEHKENKLSNKEELLLYMSGGIWIATSITYPILGIYCQQHLSNLVDIPRFAIYFILFSSAIAFFLLMHKALKPKYKKIFIMAMSLVQIFSYTCGYFTFNKSWAIEDIYTLKNQQAIENLDKNYAIKDETRYFIHNFPLILDHKSMSTWLHVNGMYANLNARALGYGYIDTQIGSYGGTAFSDLLASVRYIISYNELDDFAYTLIDEFDITYNLKQRKVYLYEYKYNLPLGLVVEKQEELIDLDYTSNPFENQNLIYKKMFDKENNIVNIIKEEKNVLSKEYEFYLSGNNLLYLYLEDVQYDNVDIYVNDTLWELERNGILNLGTYSDETVKVKVESSTKLDVVEFASLKVDLLSEIVNGQNQSVSMSIRGRNIDVIATTDKSGYLYIPINYENNSWTASVNGKQVEVERYMEGYLLIKVEEGVNKITLTFTPMYLKTGIMLTCVTLLLLVILFVINIKFKFFEKKGVIMITSTLGMVLGIGVGIFVYLLPLMK